MAYVKILTIHCRNDYLQTAVDYAVSPDKTIEERLGIAGDYAVDTDKTRLDEVRYASCLNIPGLENSTKIMMSTKRKYGKTEGILGYHVIQSFSPDDKVTPEQAHEIGRQYAQELFGDYEVVIGTHVDRNHIHNHIVFNSVSCIDGKKFHAKKGYLRYTMRKVSDRYCKENGLSVIHYTSTREMTQMEWYERHWREGTFKEGINRDIRAAAARSKSLAGMLIQLENMGYKIDSSRKHITLLPPDGRKAWRLDKFYTDAELKGMTEGGGMARIASRRYQASRGRYRMARGSRHAPHKLTQFEYMYLRWLKMLGETPYRRRAYVPRSEYRKADEYMKQMKFTRANDLRTLSQVISFREKLQARQKELNVEQNKLSGHKNRYTKLFDAHKKVMRWQPIISKLDDETKEEYAAAFAVLKKSGYENNLSAVDQLRVGLEMDILKNKNERMDVQEQIRMCRKIEKDTEQIDPLVRREHQAKAAFHERIRSETEKQNISKRQKEKGQDIER